MNLPIAFSRTPGKGEEVTTAAFKQGHAHMFKGDSISRRRERGGKNQNKAHFLMIYVTDTKYLLYISFGMYFGSKPVIPADNELHIYFETAQTNANWKHVLFD